MRRQDWKESLAIGAKGVAEVSDFLKSDLVKSTWFNTHFVHNVEEDKRYQGSDVDLLWVIPIDTYLRCHTVEVKTDRNHHTGNFFFETVSVESRNKPGAFIITRAEWLFYYFIELKQLYCFPMGELRPWFLKYETEFLEKRANSDDKEKNLSWSTIGRIVPIKRVIESIPNRKIFKKDEESWAAV